MSHHFPDAEPKSLREFLVREPDTADQEMMAVAERENRIGSQSSPTKESWDHFQRLPEIRRILTNLSGGIVVDGGSGVARIDHIPRMCKKYGVHAYIGVDLHHIDSYGFGPDPVQDWVSPSVKNVWNPMRYFLVRSNMADHFPRVPDGSVHVTMNNIDECIVSNTFAIHLALSVARMCGPGKLAFGIEARPLEYLSGSCQKTRNADLTHPDLWPRLEAARKQFMTRDEDGSTLILQKK